MKRGNNAGCYLLYCFLLWRIDLLLQAVELVRNCQFLTALCTTGSQYATTISGSHSLTETMLVLSLSQRRLECSFHCFVLFICFFFFFFDGWPSVRLRNRVAKVDTFFEMTKKCADFVQKIWAFFCFLLLLQSKTKRKVK